MSQLCRHSIIIASWLIGAITFPARGEPPGEKGQLSAEGPRNPLPPGAIARMGTVRTPPADVTRSLVYSPDGRRLISTSLNDVRIWNASNGNELKRFSDFPEGDSGFHGFAISPDQTRFASVSGSAIDVRDLATGKKVRTLKHSTRMFWPMAYSPDGKNLAVKELDGLTLWNAETGKEIRRFTDSGMLGGPAAFSPDGRRIAFCQSDSVIRVCTIDTGKKQAEFSPANKPGAIFSSVRFSPDGKTLAAVMINLDGKSDRRSSWRDGSVVLWDMTTGAELGFPNGPARGNVEFVFSRDSKKLVLGGKDGTIYVWDLVRQREARRLTTHAGPILAMALSPDQKTLATAGSGVAIRQWDLATGQEVSQPLEGHQDKVTAVAFSPDSKILATMSEDRTLRLWDARTGHERQRMEGVTVMHEWPTMVTVLLFSPDGQVLFANCGDSTIRFWDAQTGKQQRCIERPLHRIRTAMCLSSDGKTLAVCEKNDPAEYYLSAPRIVLYELHTGRQLNSLPGPSSSIFNLMFSKGDAVLLAASFSGSTRQLRVHVLDAKTADELRHFDFMADGKAPQIAFAPDSHWAAVQDRADADSEALYQVRFYDLASGNEARRSLSYWKPLQSLVFSPDSRALAGLSAEDGQIHYWESVTARERRVFEEQRGGRALCFSPQATLLASAGDDTTALVWDLAGQIPARKETLTAEELSARWSDLTGEDAARAAAAIWKLVGFPQQTVAFLRQHLRPIPVVDSRELSRLVADLESDRPAARQQAASKLDRLGEVAAPALREALKSTRSAAAQRQIALLLEETDPVAFAPNVEKLRTSRALEILEHLGTPPARELLRELARGAPEAARTQEAQAAIKRLASRLPARE